MGAKRLRVSLLGAVLAAGLVFVVLTLAAPWALGWPPANERQAVLNTALRGMQDTRYGIKLVPAAELPTSVWIRGTVPSGNVWVVATSGHLPGLDGEMGLPPATWTVQVFLEDSGLDVGGTAGTSSSWPPFFDRLPERSPPSWWPNLSPNPEVAAPILLVIGLLIIVGIMSGLAAGIGVATRGARRLARPT